MRGAPLSEFLAVRLPQSRDLWRKTDDIVRVGFHSFLSEFNLEVGHSSTPGFHVFSVNYVLMREQELSFVKYRP